MRTQAPQTTQRAPRPAKPEPARQRDARKNILTRRKIFRIVSRMALFLSPLLADRFARVLALLLGLIGDHALRGRQEDRLAGLIQAYFRRIGQRFLARATAPPHPREGIPLGPRGTAPAAPGAPATPRTRPAPPQGREKARRTGSAARAARPGC